MLGISDAVREGKQQLTDTKFLIAAFERLTAEYGNQLEKTPIETRSYLSTSHPLRFHQDDRVSVVDFMEYPDTILVGKVFLCRTITPCIKMLSLLTVVEVPDAPFKDKAVFLSLHNNQQPMGEKHELSIPIFSEGTILAVGNPMLFQPAADENYVVRCDNPADVFVLSQKEFEHFYPGLNWPSGKSRNEDIVLETNTLKIQDWKSVGEYWLEKKNYIAALQYFTVAVDQDHEDLEALILRSSMNLELKCYQLALKDATEILDKDDLNLEAICHKASALIGLSEFEAAMEFLGDHIKQGISPVEDVRNIRFKELMVKAETWRKQERHGDYDLVKMFRCGSGYSHDCADYIGSVAEQEVAGKGRGMVATKSIKCGDLIIAVKALEMMMAGKDEGQKWMIDTETRGGRSRAWVNLWTSIAHRMIRDPDAEKAIYNLYDGSGESNLNTHESEKHIDLRRIAAICKFNSFTECSAESENHGDVIGVWAAASLFNHGCYDSNSTWKLCGNVLFVRASKDIKKGEEITFLYYSYLTEFTERVLSSSKYNFNCQCSLCRFDSREPDSSRKRRREILLELDHLFATVPRQFVKITQLIKELQQQRPDNPELNISPVSPMMQLSEMYIHDDKLSLAADIIRDMLKMFSKTALTEDSISCSMSGITCYLECNDVANAKTCASGLKQTMIQVFGVCSKELLEYVQEGLGETMALLEIE